MTSTLTRRLDVNGGALADIKPARPSKLVRERIPAKYRSRQTLEQAAADLEAAAEHLTPCTWRKSTIGTPSNCCALGAISTVTGLAEEDGCRYPPRLQAATRDEELRAALAATLAHIETPRRFEHDVVALNDDAQTTLGDVKAVLRRAALRARRLAASYKR